MAEKLMHFRRNMQKKRADILCRKTMVLHILCNQMKLNKSMTLKHLMLKEMKQND